MAILAANGPPVEVTLRRSGQARRVSLRVSSLDGRVTLTLPNRVSLADAMDFARAREDWIRTALARIPAPQQARPGMSLLFEGRELPVEQGPTRGPITLTQNTILVTGNPETLQRRLAVWLKFHAQDRLVSACDHYESALGKRRSRLVLRDTRSRWGSCSAAGVLMFNWRLIMAPPEVLAYVAAHEVAHLAEMNHSDRYWAVLARLMPGYNAPRQWLRDHGNTLHAWKFD